MPGGLRCGQVKLGYQTGHIKVWNQFAVEAQFDFASTILAKRQVQDFAPHVALCLYLLHQGLCALMRQFRVFRDGLVEISQPTIGRGNGFLEAAEGRQRGGLFSQCFRLVQFAC